jgi:hypothetical protein
MTIENKQRKRLLIISCQTLKYRYNQKKKQSNLCIEFQLRQTKQEKVDFILNIN